MKNILFLLLPSFLLLACGETKKQDNGNQVVRDSSQVADDSQTNTEKVIYKGAVVYAASTDFVFENQKGEQIMVRVSNPPEERTVNIPDNMLDPDAGAAGPPGANPALAGKEFLLLKNEKGEVKEIRLAQ